MQVASLQVFPPPKPGLAEIVPARPLLWSITGRAHDWELDMQCTACR